jgi:3-phenylpropionate/trans-cinnamate dioxygenase ferredoxin reductase component
VSESERHDVVIVGTGHAGSHAAITLRQRKFSGTIALVGEEPDFPYERPPLSKDYLSGERTFDRMLLRPQGFWQERDISLRLGRRVVSVEAGERRVMLADGQSIGYGTLIWAAGGQPRMLTCAGAELRGVHTLRSRGDVDRMQQELPSVERVAIVGGGYIGLEAAASLRKFGKTVTVVEALDRVLARVAGEPLSRFYETEHRAHGVTILLDSKIQCIEGRAGRASGLRLVSGDLIPADLVIVGIGILPVSEPLIAAGAKGGNGVAVDEYARTSLTDVYAVGDCALHANQYAHGLSVRLESVQNACEMAATAAKAIMGELEPYRAVPWFWSNQYDLRLQTVGLSVMHDDLIVRGTIAARSFCVIYRREGHVVALDCVNTPKDFMQGRALVEKHVAAERSALADPAVPLKSLA